MTQAATATAAIVPMEMKELVALLAAVQTLTKQIEPLSGEVHAIADDVAALKTDVAVLKQAVMGNGKEPLQRQIDEVAGKLNTVREQLAREQGSELGEEKKSGSNHHKWFVFGIIVAGITQLAGMVYQFLHLIK